VDQKLLQKLLNLLPNLESLELSHIISSNQEQSNWIKWDLKSTKIQRVKINYCSGFENLLESLENCVIKELDFHHYSDTVYGIFQTTRKVEVFAIEVPMERRNIRAS
jgi:hypothetical protein